jgi:TolB protein
MSRFTALSLALSGALLVSSAGGSGSFDALTAVPLWAQDQEPIYELKISGASGARKHLAVPEFSVTGASQEIQAAAKTIASVLWDDLEFEGEFDLVPHEAANRIPRADTMEALPYARWSELGVDAVVLGAVTSTPEGLLSVSVQVVGTRGDLARRQIFGKRYSGGGCSVKNPRNCAHYISDDFHKSQGIDGVARTRLAFASDRSSETVPGRVADNAAQEIYISDYDGFNPIRVTVNRGLNISPSWAPDGRSLAYTSYRTGYPDVYVQSIYQMGRVSRPAAGTEVAQNFLPSWSPDGNRLAFTSSREGHTAEVYVVNRDGTNLRRLTNNKAGNLAPSWSPSGAQIVFVSGRSGDAQLYLMGADGTNLEHLNCGDSHCDHPSWSAAVNKIAYTCGSNAAGYNVCLLDMATRQIIKLTDGPGSNEQPTFAPNGRHIVFNTTRWGKKQLAMVDLKGNIYRKRITNTGNNTYPDWSRIPQ